LPLAKTDTIENHCETKRQRRVGSNHLSEKNIQLVLPITKITTGHKVVSLFAPSSGGIVQLEGPQEVGGLLEVRSNGEDFVDEIFCADDVEFTKGLFYEGVVVEWNSTALDFSISTFVYQIPNGLQVGVTPGDVRVRETQHIQGGLVELHEDSVVDLTDAEQLHDGPRLGGHSSHTTNSHNKGQFRLIRNVKVVRLLRLTLQSELITLLGSVLTDILFRTLEDGLLLYFGMRSAFNGLAHSSGGALSCSLPLLQQSLRDLRKFGLRSLGGRRCCWFGHFRHF